MKKIARKIISSVSRTASLNKLIENAGRGFILPFYHLVSDKDVPHIKHLYPVTSTKRFSEDLDFLLKNYKPVSPDFLPQYLNGSKERAFLLSFDDGLREFYEIAAPILLEKGIPCVCFVNSAFVDNKAMFYRMKASLLIEYIQCEKLSAKHKKAISQLFHNYGLKYTTATDFLKIKYNQQNLLEETAALLEFSFIEYLHLNRPYLTSEQIKDLKNKGFVIGGHSATHPFYYDLTGEEQMEETLGCMDFLNEKFDMKEKFFSFPFSDYGIKRSFFEKISSKVDYTFGTANLKEDAVKSNFQRMGMEVKNAPSAEHIIKSEYVNYIIKKRLNKHIINRQ